MQDILASFTGKYGLSKTEVMTEIESVLAAMLSQWYRLEVMVFFREDSRLEAVAYNDSGGVILQKPVDLLKMKGQKTLKKHLENSLEKAAVLKQAAHYKSFEKELLWGEIASTDSDHNFYVEAEIIPGERIRAFCPIDRVGLHERLTKYFSIGSRRAFHLRRVEPVSLSGTPRLKITVDRVSKTLVENLLRNQIGYGAETAQLRCLKRYVGHKSVVLTTSPIPKAAIIAVDRELKERVEVRIVKSLPGECKRSQSGTSALSSAYPHT
jgi:hypothetical protein